jgi:hypothetical protein
VIEGPERRASPKFPAEVETIYFMQ